MHNWTNKICDKKLLWVEDEIIKAKSFNKEWLQQFPVPLGTPNAEGIPQWTEDDYKDYMFSDRDCFENMWRKCRAILENPNIVLDEYDKYIIKAYLKAVNAIEPMTYNTRLYNRITRSDVARFVKAHEENYERALEEIKAGSKKTHWIWYIFPQMAGIPGTHSRNSLYYGIKDRIEAISYIQHPILHEHLIEITQAVLDTNKAAYEIFGDDAIKVKSCMQLFASVSDIPQFKQLIKKNNWN